MSADATPMGTATPPALWALVAPATGMERQAKTGGVKLTLALAIVCALLAGFAQAWRVDAAASTLQKLDNEGRLASMSDRQVDEETHKAERVYQVLRVAGAAVEAPVALGLACLAVVALGWFLKGRLKGSAVVPVAAATLLPGAVANLLDALVALRHATLPPEPTLLAPRTAADVLQVLGHPLVGPMTKLGGALDFYALWAALLLGYGVAFAAQVPLRRAVVGTVVAWVCWRLLTHVALGGGS